MSLSPEALQVEKGCKVISPEVCFIGHVSIDEVVAPDGVSDIHIGGAAYAAAVGAALITRNVGVVSRIGFDFPATTVLQEHIDHWSVIRESGASSRFKLDYTKGDIFRGLEAHFGVGERVLGRDVPIEWIKGAWIHVATMPPGQQIGIIEHLRMAGARGISVDTVELFVINERQACVAAASAADLVFVNEVEFGVLKESGMTLDRPIVVKQGKAGASMIRGDTTFIQCPGLPKVVVDPTNAGDVFAGVFLSSWLCRKSGYETALRNAVKTASRSLELRCPDALLTDPKVAP